PKLGARFAVIGDPQGATIYAYEPFDNMFVPDTTKPGEFAWAELVTTNHDAAFRFYERLFEWKRLREHDLGPLGRYLLFGLGSKPLGGMFTMSKKMMTRPGWNYYIEVDKLDARIEKAIEKGGKRLYVPGDVPGGARIAHMLDPQGVRFSMQERPQ
ncbi:MAG: VOC family protein, partial [Polyangiaceae bacterium]|nr:VOC family protein [Polyangiaceae bacterium]